MGTDVTNKIEETLNKMDEKVQSVIDKANEEAKNNAKLGNENKQAVDALNKQIEEFNAEMVEIQQKLEAAPEEKPEEKSIGNQFAESEAFKNMQSGSSQKARFDVQNNTIVGSDATVAPDRQAGIVGGAFSALRLTDVIPSFNTTSNAVEYTRELAFTNSAAETAEGAQKPETDVTFELVSVPIRTIAHFIKLSKQIMDDAPAIASYVDGRMRYGVNLRLDNQLLNGNGTGNNISGIRDAGNLTVFTPQASVSAVDNIRKAITAVEQADYSATAVILNPADVEAVDLGKATDGHFIAANPRVANARTVWGLPIVTTNRMPAGQFVVAAFSMAYGFWNRMGTVVELFEQNEDDVERNLVTMRAEMRGALASYRPVSSVGGALTA